MPDLGHLEHGPDYTNVKQGQGGCRFQGRGQFLVQTCSVCLDCALEDCTVVCS